ncbi:hypothetical protein OUZ56_019617 [Daphnia magna]|uniref:Uncharacterized protein n=1 Tax=Daphnia magna TaxID=35525 RepID=A0ABQ9ZC35_9CRUS|nr:hypothetical protein OUZ56_019617 [Daphnia magna]
MAGGTGVEVHIGSRSLSYNVHRSMHCWTLAPLMMTFPVLYTPSRRVLRHGHFRFVCVCGKLPVLDTGERSFPLEFDIFETT